MRKTISIVSVTKLKVSYCRNNESVGSKKRLHCQEKEKGFDNIYFILQGKYYCTNFYNFESFYNGLYNFLLNTSINLILLLRHDLNNISVMNIIYLYILKSLFRLK